MVGPCAGTHTVVHRPFLTSDLFPVQGDRVIVVSGDLKNLVGTVERVGEDGKVDVMPRMEGLTEVLTFDLPQLEKYFTVRAPFKDLLNSQPVHGPSAQKSNWTNAVSPRLCPDTLQSQKVFYSPARSSKPSCLLTVNRASGRQEITSRRLAASQLARQA